MKPKHLNSTHISKVFKKQPLTLPGISVAATLFLLLLASTQAKPKPSPTTTPTAAWKMEFQLLQQQVRLLGPDYPAYEKLQRETLRKEALIQNSDKTPADIILRRTSALLTHLKKRGADLQQEEKDLNKLASADRPSLTEADQLDLFTKVAELRRTIAFKNPLLDFDDLIFLKHIKMVLVDRHMIYQYLGFNQV
jgi:hypothetical protein